MTSKTAAAVLIAGGLVFSAGAALYVSGSAPSGQAQLWPSKITASSIKTDAALWQYITEVNVLGAQYDSVGAAATRAALLSLSVPEVMRGRHLQLVLLLDEIIAAKAQKKSAEQYSKEKAWREQMDEFKLLNAL